MSIDAGTIAQIVSTGIFVLAIPWAMKVVAQLASIKAELNAIQWQEKAIGKLQDEVKDIQLAMAKAD